MSQLAQALEVALELLLSQAVPLPRRVLIGLGQHGAELGDRFHVLPGLPGEPRFWRNKLCPGKACAESSAPLIAGRGPPIIHAPLPRTVLARGIAWRGRLYPTEPATRFKGHCEPASDGPNKGR